MSLSSLALTRPNSSTGISALAENHLKHDLTEGDRYTLQSASDKLGVHAVVGSLLGLGLGLFLAYRSVPGALTLTRRGLIAKAGGKEKIGEIAKMRESGKPMELSEEGILLNEEAEVRAVMRYKDGREVELPITKHAEAPPLTPFISITAYFLFATGGLFLGGEFGLLSGSYSARKTISRDPEIKKRIETAFRRFRADVLRKEADALDEGEGTDGMIGL